MRRVETTGRRDQEALFRALQHPLRWSVLAFLQEHGVGSASDIATTLNLPVPNVSYHVRRLDSLGLVEQIASYPIRGAIKHVYRTTDLFRNSILAMLGEEIVRLAAISYPDIGPSAIAHLDRQALGELAHDMEHLFARVDELGAQTAARASRSRAPLPTVTTAVLFAIGRSTEIT